MPNKHPHLIIIAGPNGAGKSTTAPSLLNEILGVTEFVNADMISQGLSGFKPEGTDIQAGRIMLDRLNYLAKKRIDFAFETTLASKSFVPRIIGLKKQGYDFHLVFLWLPNEEFAVARVLERVRSGGHNVPKAAIRRRYSTGLKNFFELYLPISDSWRFYDNSELSGPRLIACGHGAKYDKVVDVKAWDTIAGEFEHEKRS